MKLTPKQVERFWIKVAVPTDRSLCWLWTAALGSDGYGQYGEYRAHRMAWYLTHGTIPDGLHVLHKCDNPPCVNPSHLFMGTHANNMLDRSVKGRANRSFNRTVSDEALQRIPLLYGSGKAQKDIAVEVGVSAYVVSQVIAGKYRKVP